jgi:lysophospholipase L1-like esterase
MRRPRQALSLLLLGLALAAPASADALSRRLLVNGDSLAVGTQPYLPRELRRWKVTQSTAVSRHAYEGADVMRAFGHALPRVIHVSLGTNDDPRSVSSFRSAIREVMAVAGPKRCVVWANIVRPAVAGASYAGYNRALAQESRPRQNLRVVNWARLVGQNPYWLAGDGVHVSAEGYQARARAVARSVRRCR